MVDGVVAGALLLADRIRPETPRALRALRAAGVERIVMVTGDRAASADGDEPDLTGARLHRGAVVPDDPGVRTELESGRGCGALR